MSDQPNSAALADEINFKVRRACEHAENGAKAFSAAVPEDADAEEGWMHLCSLYVYIEEWLKRCDNSLAIESMLMLFRAPYRREEKKR